MLEGADERAVAVTSGAGPGMFGLLEHRGFLDHQPDVEADGQQQRAQKEGHTPTPLDEGGRSVSHEQVDDKERRARKRKGQGGTDLREDAVEPTLLGGRVLCREKCGAGPFPADSKPLRDPQGHQQDRRGHADRIRSGQASDKNCRGSHE